MRKTPKSKPRARRAVDHYAPARRFEQIRALLESTGGASIYEIAERLGISTRSVIRYLRTMEAAHEPIYADKDGARNVWRLMPSAHKGAVTLTMQQMVSLFLSRRVFDFLEGTGFKEDIDEVFTKLEACLRRKDFDASKALAKKLFDVNEAPHIYEGRLEDVDDLVTALLKDERLDITYESARRTTTFVFSPYSLLVYHKGLYVAGYSDFHEKVITLALDGVRSIAWRKGDRFEYPKDFRPESLVDGAFGLIRGEPVRVRIAFDATVARRIRRRRWHASQTIAPREDGGVVLTMKTGGMEEIRNWVLSFGAHAEVLEPAELRETVAREHEVAARTYRRARSTQSPAPSTI